MKEAFSCARCGHKSHQWFGRCPGCGAWSTATQPVGGGGGGLVPVALTDAPPDPPRAATGIDEVDRVLGGGIVRGSVVLLAGEPGIGKSTLVLQLLAGVARHDAHTLLVSGEESIEQVAARAARLGLTDGRIRVAASPSLPALLAACDADPPTVVVVDSIQTLVDERLESAPGSVTQVRECAAALVGHSKRTGTAVILVGHVTKDGGVAGPKTLEHVVDVVLSLDGDRSGTLRLLRSAKNRFGATDETGVFVMSSVGLEPVADPSAFLLADRRAGVAGSIVFPSLEGSRPVLVEIQGLVDTETRLPQPRRVAIGLESRRLSMLVGVLSTRGDLPLAGKDLFVAAAGGLAVREPAADLAVCLALYSASLGIPIDGHAVAVGEVGLSGEIRRVPAIARRLSEARRLGFSTAYVPFGFDQSIAGLRLLRVPDLAAAFEQARGTSVVSA